MPQKKKSKYIQYSSNSKWIEMKDGSFSLVIEPKKSIGSNKVENNNNKVIHRWSNEVNLLILSRDFSLYIFIRSECKLNQLFCSSKNTLNVRKWCLFDIMFIQTVLVFIQI